MLDVEVRINMKHDLVLLHSVIDSVRRQISRSPLGDPEAVLARIIYNTCMTRLELTVLFQAEDLVSVLAELSLLADLQAEPLPFQRSRSTESGSRWVKQAALLHRDACINF